METEALHPSAARLLQATKSLHGIEKPSDIANALNIPKQHVTNWKKRGVSKEGALAAQAILGISATYLLEGTGQVEVEIPAREPAEWEDIRGYAQAVGLGGGPEAQEYAETHRLKFRADSLARKRLNPEKLAVMYGSGDSMLPRIHPGDAILFDTADTTPRDGQLYVIMLNGAAAAEYQVKRCQVIADMVFFSADNPAGDHNWRKPRLMEDRKRPITVIGRVRWIGSWEG